MKKLLVTMLALSLCISLTACGSSADKDTQKTSEKTEQSQSKTPETETTSQQEDTTQYTKLEDGAYCVYPSADATGQVAKLENGALTFTGELVQYDEDYNSTTILEAGTYTIQLADSYTVTASGGDAPSEEITDADFNSMEYDNYAGLPPTFVVENGVIISLDICS